MLVGKYGRQSHAQELVPSMVVVVLCPFTPTYIRLVCLSIDINYFRSCLHLFDVIVILLSMPRELGYIHPDRTEYTIDNAMWLERHHLLCRSTPRGCIEIYAEAAKNFDGDALAMLEDGDEIRAGELEDTADTLRFISRALSAEYAKQDSEYPMVVLTVDFVEADLLIHAENAWYRRPEAQERGL